MTTPHQVGQVAKAEMIVAHVLETAPADADHDRIATVVIATLLNAGWCGPRGLEVPALRPVNVASEDQRRQHIERAAAEVAAVKLRMTTVTKESA